MGGGVDQQRMVSGDLGCSVEEGEQMVGMQVVSGVEMLSCAYAGLWDAQGLLRVEGGQCQ